MKNKNYLLILAALSLLLSPAAMFAQGGGSGGFAPGSAVPNNPFAPGAIDPATGLPVSGGTVSFSTGGSIDPATGMPGGVPPGMPSRSIHAFFDPNTGLPVNPSAAPAEPWKADDWKEPAKTLAEITYEGLPISEVALDLAKQFTNAFDVLLPHDWEGSSGEESRDWLSTSVHLRLKNVAASEIFNAMNLTFENNRTPLRWVLKMNGRRPVALLRVVQPPRMEYGIERRTIRRVIYVGDLIGDGKSGMTMQQIIKTVSDVYQMSFNRNMEGVQFHKDAQLLIVTGTNEQLDLVTQTLSGMKQKIGLERGRMHYSPNPPPQPVPAPEYIKPESPK